MFITTNHESLQVRELCPPSCESSTGTGPGSVPCTHCTRCGSPCFYEFFIADVSAGNGSGRKLLAANPNSCHCCFPIEPPPPPPPEPKVCCSTPYRASSGLSRYAARASAINYPACC